MERDGLSVSRHAVARRSVVAGMLLMRRMREIRRRSWQVRGIGWMKWMMGNHIRKVPRIPSDKGIGLCLRCLLRRVLPIVRSGRTSTARIVSPLPSSSRRRALLTLRRFLGRLWSSSSLLLLSLRPRVFGDPGMNEPQLEKVGANFDLGTVGHFHSPHRIFFVLESKPQVSGSLQAFPCGFKAADTHDIYAVLGF